MTLLALLASAALLVGCGGDDDETAQHAAGSAGTAGSAGSIAGTSGAAGAGATSGTAGTAGTGGASGAAGSLPAAICNPGGSHWVAGTKAFEEGTADWGLSAELVDGQRIAAVDFDGDGWTDLIIRTVGVLTDDFNPGGVRRTWLLRNNGMGKFVDVTETSGIRQNRTATDPKIGRPGEVIAFADLDNDGDLDVYTGLSTVPPATGTPTVETSETMFNNGDGTFSLGPADTAARVPTSLRKDAPAGASFIDFDRDGFVDLWVAQNSDANGPLQSRLYRNDGTGKLVDVTVAQGLKTLGLTVSNLNNDKAHTNSWSAAACDLNNDGNAELLAASYGRAPNLLWQGSGADGAYKYTNRGIASGYAFDDNQNWTDNESARCWCHLHPTDMGCEGVPAPQHIPCTQDSDAFRWDNDYDQEPFRLGGNSGTTVCADVDNDGAIDLLTTEIVHWDVGQSSDHSELLLNTGEPDVRFTRPGNDTTGLTREHKTTQWNDGDMTGAVFDFDNDGWPDVYIGSSDYPGARGLLWHQSSPRNFERVPIDVGIDHHRSQGIAVADFDHDGDLDVVVGHSLFRCGDPDPNTPCYATGQARLFRNVLGQQGNYVQIRLEGGTGTNRSAIGARVTLKAGDVTQTQEVGGGHGHFGIQDDLVLHFGLGASCDAQVTVRWPDATLTTQSFALNAGYRYLVTQGADPVVDPRIAK